MNGPVTRARPSSGLVRFRAFEAQGERRFWILPTPVLSVIVRDRAHDHLPGSSPLVTHADRGMNKAPECAGPSVDVGRQSSPLSFVVLVTSA
jgi:hypothetical protein